MLLFSDLGKLLISHFFSGAALSFSELLMSSFLDVFLDTSSISGLVLSSEDTALDQSSGG